MTDDEIVDRARECGLVSDHSVRWHPTSWATKINERPETGVLLLPLARIVEACADRDSRGRAPITRQDVVEHFARSPLDGYLAAIIWGCGSGARNRARMLRVFVDNDDVLLRIDALVAACRDAHPAQAWDYIKHTHHLHRLGIAFGTKVAYFAALSSRGPGARDLPLIADANVRTALGSAVTANKQCYVAYCVRAEKLAAQLPGVRGRADQVELALFLVAGESARAARKSISRS